MILQRLKKAWLPSNRAFFVSGLLVLLSPLLQAACDKTPQQLKALQALKVASVIDGDSVRLHNGEQLRLIGVNTPEMKDAQPLAEEATAYLQQLLRSEKLYWQPGQQSKDRYQRYLGHLFLADGRNVEALMLQQGLGFLVAIPPNLALLDCHRQQRDDARLAQRGVWGLAAYRAKAASQLDEKNVGFQRIRGRITDVSMRGKHWWLQLDGPAVLRVAAKDQHAFDADQIKALAGETVTASGWVIHRRLGENKRKYSPFMLLLTHPALLEIGE